MEKVGATVGILQDLPGPKLRVGKLESASMDLARDEEVVLTYASGDTSGRTIPVLYPRIAVDLKPGHAVFIADGLIRLRVRAVRNGRVHCRVLNGGTIRTGNGVNMPHSALALNAFTEEDKRHLAFGLQHDVDFVGISFVGNAQDVKRVRAFCLKRRANPFLIAKIERQQALNNLSEIVDAADGIMVARGDLGVEVPFSDIPGLQKKIVSVSRKNGKPVIVATQVLESMVQNPRPTRAEATDIANAVLESADAIMLSGETATGKYPRESVKALSDVIQASEKTGPPLEMDAPARNLDLSDIIAHEACHVARRIKAKVIVIPSRSGKTVARISRFRPWAPVLAVVKEELRRRQLCLYWGVRVWRGLAEKRFHRPFVVRKELLRNRIARTGDKVLLVGDDPDAPAGETNLIRVVRI